MSKKIQKNFIVLNWRGVQDDRINTYEAIIWIIINGCLAQSIFLYSTARSRQSLLSYNSLSAAIHLYMIWAQVHGEPPGESESRTVSVLYKRLPPSVNNYVKVLECRIRFFNAECFASFLTCLSFLARPKCTQLCTLFDLRKFCPNKIISYRARSFKIE